MNKNHTINYIDSINRLYNKLEEILGENKLSCDNLISVVVLLMQYVETYKELKGEEKRNIIIRVLKRFIADKIGNEEGAYDINLLIKTTLPDIIDSLVAVDKKQLVIKTQKNVKNLFSCCN